MASTVPAKSQPLHNFTLPHHLKWNKDGQPGGGQHQRRRSVKSPSRRPNTSSLSPLRQSPLRDSVSATPPRHQSPLSDSMAPPPSLVRRDYYSGKPSSAHGESQSPAPFPFREWAKRSPIGGDPPPPPPPPPPPHLRRHASYSSKGKGESIDFQRTIQNLGVSSPNPEQVSQKFEMKSKAKEIDSIDSTVIMKSKILIKIPCKNNKVEDENRPDEAPKTESKIEAAETKNNHNHTEEETKIWNLRPRKPIRVPMSSNNGSSVKNKSPSPLTNQSNNKDQKKKEKKKLSVFLSLSKEEIEEDIFSLTGSKPARRPKKRPKFIQKQSLYPGSWLVSINADSYKVSENSLKG